MHLYFGIIYLNIFANLLHIVHSPLLPILLLYLPYPLSSFALNLKPFFFSNHSLLSLFAPTVDRSLASWPGSHLLLIVISLLSFISTSFIYACVCKLASYSHSRLAGFTQALKISPLTSFTEFITCGAIIIIIIINNDLIRAVHGQWHEQCCLEMYSQHRTQMNNYGKRRCKSSLFFNNCLHCDNGLLNLFAVGDDISDEANGQLFKTRLVKGEEFGSPNESAQCVSK